MRAQIAAVRRARHLGRGPRRMAALCAFCACAALTLTACGTTNAASPGAASSDGGTTATYALAPESFANYIFPFDDLDNYTAYNIDDFQYLLYRPLYWFGKGTGPLLNTSLSLAYRPTYVGQVVTIRLKRGWKWSNGTPVDAQDVVFWMNMMVANKAVWGDYITGYFPDNVTDVHAVNSDEVQMTIRGHYSQTWFTDNELSQITPLPLAWDTTASGPTNCAGGSMADCRSVYSYLNAQALDIKTYGTSKIWQVVDGPWRVQSLTAQDTLTLVFNYKYSGKVPAHHISKFIEEPFTSELAEYDVLQDPTSSSALDVGYLPTDDAPPPSSSGVGANPVSLSDYNLITLYPWQLSYFPYNFANPAVGAIFDQLYFRTAFQDLVDQEGIIDGPLHGYGKVTTGPVADYPVTPYLSPQLASVGDRWPLNISNADSELRTHGWSPGAKGIYTCTRPGSGSAECGAGIKAGTSLSFTLVYAIGTDWMVSAVRELASNAALAGINLKLSGLPFGDVIDDLGNPSDWEMAFWGTWTFSPDYLPTGEELFMTNAADNFGAYSNSLNDALTRDTLDARTSKAFYQAMYKWENNLAVNLPVVWEPDAPELVEAIKGLTIGAQNSALTITPEDWYWQK